MQDSGYRIIFPGSGQPLEQDEELYEEIFNRRLMCTSPQVLGDMLADSMEAAGVSMQECRALDFGAGNGTVGEIIRDRGGGFIVGIDILPQARDAAARDRPGVYDHYHVMDLTQIDSEPVKELRQYDFNTLITVGALGFGDIPPGAFLNALNLIRDDGWVAFNIKDRFLSNDDDTGYRSALDQIMGKTLSVHSTKRYCHRRSLGGEEINYIGIVGRKSRKQ